MNTRLSILVISLTGSSLVGCTCGAVEVPIGEVTASSEENVAGDSSHETNVDEVDVEEANVDVDVENDVDVDVDVDVGQGEDRELRDATDVGVADGITVEARYQGPIDERVDLTVSFDDDVRAAVDSIEWLVRDPVLDEPTVFDDEDGFAWGEPQSNDPVEYTLAVRFDDMAAPFAWTTESSLCVDDACDGRAVSAACAATIVLRAWLTDGSAREAIVHHESARPACW